MKKIGKLSINLDKVISNDELINLKGGGSACCVCGNGQAIATSLSQLECYDDCKGAGYGGGTWYC